MEIKGIDVSAWQGSINWKTVADYGMGFAILRITEEGNKIDSQFEANYKGCITYKIPVGVYKYSYAKTVAEAEAEADAVLKVLNKRKLDFPIFYDLEWSEQRKLGSSAIEKIAKAFLNKVEKAGYLSGLYANVDWYNNVFTANLRKYDCWLASYPDEDSDNGTLQERLRPFAGIGWQYSSKATIPGISTKVDRNVFYKDYSSNSTGTSNNTSTGSSGGGSTVTSKAQAAINAVIATAKAEVGYLEKRSNSQLDDKTANAGSGNYTKYWRDVYSDWNGSAWCAVFISWVFMQCFGQAAAQKLLKHWPYVYCPTLGNLFTRYANPEVGDIVIFWRNGEFAHTGIVTKVSGDRFWTVEGNTSGASGIIANGGGVCEKSYYNSQLPGTKFCRVDWEYAGTQLKSGGSSSGSSSKAWIEKGDSGSDVKTMQTMLNKIGFDCGSADGEFGANTDKALRAFQKAYGLAVDGQYGSNSKKTLEAAYNALDGASKMESDDKGICIANTQLIGRVYPNGTHLKTYKKGTWLHPFLKQKDKQGRWWFACKADGIIQWFSSTGFNGWIKDTVGWWYVLKGYKYYKSEWRRIRGLWYEFDAKGYRKESCWSTYKGRKRYLKADGSMAHGETLTINGKKYQFEEGGGVKEL